VAPRLTAQRCISFWTLLATAAVLAFSVSGRREAATRILVAVLAGAVAVAVVGLGILAVDPGNAVQDATPSTSARFRGLGQNPNTVAMLFAVGMPIAVWLAVTRPGRARVAAIAALLLLAGSIVASGSRAALVAGFVGAVVPVLAALRSLRARAAALAVCTAALAAGILIAEIPDPNPNVRGSASSYARECTKHDAECFLRLEDDVGRPAQGRFQAPKGRSLFGSSGRRQAWEGALEQGADRPVAGFGFGTEGRVFVDRYYSFEGGVPENSFIGIFLQLGAAGAALLCALLASLVVAAVRALVIDRAEARLLAATCAAVLFVGLALALSQSYLYAAGNTATLSVWICAFLPTALAAGRRGAA
jgi:O-antigen ligase/polysaccharide polymerase Wzy-like membrane protein